MWLRTTLLYLLRNAQYRTNGQSVAFTFSVLLGAERTPSAIDVIELIVERTLLTLPTNNNRHAGTG